MKFLLDENLSPKLVARLADSFPGTAHADGVGLRGRADAEIWQYAAQHGFVLVSKDDDFRQLSFLRGAPPKVIWLLVGNAGTRAIGGLLLLNRDRIAAFVGDPEEALLTLALPSPDAP